MCPNHYSAPMKAFYCDQFVLPLPDGHRFPMRKYELLRLRLEGDTDLELLVPAPATDAQLARVHDPRYISAVASGQLDRHAERRIGFPWSPELVERSRRSVGGTIGAALAALEDGWGANLAGGTHHAGTADGGGFCVFNDVAVAAREVQARRGVRRVGVLDLDVHQGNGTADIFARDPSVHTVSVHGAANYPFRKATSDLDLPLEDGASDDPFLAAVDRAIDAVVSSRPEVVFFLAGADPYAEDKLGRLGVSTEGLAERDRRVFDACTRAGLPVAVVMAGGYAADVETIVDIHEHTVREAARRCALCVPTS